MNQRSRRDFLRDLGAGMMAAGLGATLTQDLGMSLAFADEEPARLTFGRLEPLATLLQETPTNRLLTAVVERLRGGTELRDVVAAAALANARVFGGQDYIGFHTMMALMPAYQMAGEMPAAQRALPVLKVLYRNSNRMHERRGPETMRTVAPAEVPAGQNGPELLRDQARRSQTAEAERTFAALARTPDDALNAALYAVEDGTDVHRVVLAQRAWDLVGFIGPEQAHTLLRQSVRYCSHFENPRTAEHFRTVREEIPRLLDRHRLLERPLGNRVLDDAELERLSQSIFNGSAAQGAEAVAAALADGIHPDTVAQALSLAANQLVLRDRGRPTNQASPNRPAGSCHGDSIGVHSCDAVNAWRNLSRAANARNKVLCLLLGGYQVAQDRSNRGGEFLNWTPYPSAEGLEQVRAREPAALLGALEEAIRGGDQMRACAVTAKYGQLALPPRPMFDVLLKYAVSEDGALHAEKFYRTTGEEYATFRPAFRWRQVIALAKVTASAHGQPAPGVEEGRRLLVG